MVPFYSVLNDNRFGGCSFRTIPQDVVFTLLSSYLCSGWAHGLVSPHITKEIEQDFPALAMLVWYQVCSFCFSFGHSVENNAIKDEAAPQYGKAKAIMRPQKWRLHSNKNALRNYQYKVGWVLSS